MVSYTSNAFLEAKKIELLQACKNTLKGASVEEINEFTSLRNNLKKYYEEVGILKFSHKVGKVKYYKFDSFNIQIETIREAYRLKDSQENKLLKSGNITIRKATKKELKESLKSLEKSLEVNDDKKDFPSLEDCLAYIRHSYGSEVFVLQVPQGYEVSHVDLVKK